MTLDHDLLAIFFRQGHHDVKNLLIATRLCSTDFNLKSRLR